MGESASPIVWSLLPKNCGSTSKLNLGVRVRGSSKPLVLCIFNRTYTPLVPNKRHLFSIFLHPLPKGLKLYQELQKGLRFN